MRHERTNKASSYIKQASIQKDKDMRAINYIVLRSWNIEKNRK